MCGNCGKEKLSELHLLYNRTNSSSPIVVIGEYGCVAYGSSHCVWVMLDSC